ncbi:MAG: UDP-N-acetylmuramate dehydrogenase [Planctomycetota bacterium]
MPFPDSFAQITQTDVPLAPRTWLKVGGPAQFFVEPTSADELVSVVKACHAEGLAVRLLGGGSNLLVGDDGVGGVVISLKPAAFAGVEIDGSTVRVKAGTSLATLVAATVRAGLAGLETLVGIPGTVGGALNGNAGGRQGDIGRHLTSATVVTVDGEKVERVGDDLQFGYRQSSLDELVILEAEFELAAADRDELAARGRKIWVEKKNAQPLSHQSAGCVFKNPRGQKAGQLIDRAGLKGTRVGGVSVSDRHANFFVTESGATAADVRRLIDLTRSAVADQFDVELELELVVW